MAETTGQEKAVKRAVLQAIPIPALPGWEHRMVLLEYPAGVAAPVHHHPIAGPNYVVQGSILSQWEGDEKPQVFHAGNSFVSEVRYRCCWCEMNGIDWQFCGKRCCGGGKRLGH